MDENRNTDRCRVLKEGKIIFADGMRVIDCTIRDMSDAGARLLIASTAGVPDTFHLFEKTSAMIYPATVVWRRPSAAEVKFDGAP
jgi:hypothetical protein